MHGVYREWWDEHGQQRNESEYREGERHGPLSLWYENGQREEESEWLAGEYHGLLSTWYENGQQQEEAAYQVGKRDGSRSLWYDNGQQREESLWLEGELHGTSRYSYEEGQEAEEPDCEPCPLALRQWFPNGQLRRESERFKGDRHGIQRNWYENGQQRWEWEWLEGRKDGPQRYWWENGRVERDENWLKGRITGLFEAWHPNGQLRAREHYENGKLSRTRHQDEGVTRWHANGERGFEGMLGEHGWARVRLWDEEGREAPSLEMSGDGSQLGVYRRLAVPSTTPIQLGRGQAAFYYVSGVDAQDSGLCRNIRIWSTGNRDPQAGGSFLDPLANTGAVFSSWADDDSGEDRNFSRSFCVSTEESVILIGVQGRGPWDLHVE